MHALGAAADAWLRRKPSGMSSVVEQPFCLEQPVLRSNQVAVSRQ